MESLGTVAHLDWIRIEGRIEAAAGLLLAGYFGRSALFLFLSYNVENIFLTHILSPSSVTISSSSLVAI